MFTRRPFIDVAWSLIKAEECLADGMRYAKLQDTQEAKQYFAFAENYFAPIRDLLRQGMRLPDTLQARYVDVEIRLNAVRESTDSR